MVNVDISIIIPIYNFSIYIPTCLNSIFNQSLKNFEIILLNNSKNNIEELMELYADKFDNIKLLNDYSGESGYDLAIKESKGKYIAFLDSNDYIEEDMLKKLFDECESNNLDMSICKVYSIDDVSNDVDMDLHDLSLSILDKFKNRIFSGLDILNIITEIYSKPYNKLFARDFLIKNNISYPNNIFGDKVFFYETLLKSNKISIVDEFLYVRRFNNRFIKDISNEDYSDIFYAFQLIREKFILSDAWELCKTKVYNYFIKLFVSYFNITPNIHKENFFNEFKQNLQNIIINDNILHKLNSNHVLFIKQLMGSNNYNDYLNRYGKLFSVILDCVDVENRIASFIESIINQTLDFESFIEIILIDYGVTEDAINICKHFIEKYPNNVKLLHDDEEVNHTLNFGLKYASGKYVNFLDSNNLLKEDTLSNAYNFFETHSNEISFLESPIFFFGNDFLEFNKTYEKLVSVVIPCFNVEEYIVECIESIINQTLDFESMIEIILVDDGSTDKTIGICKDFVERYPNNIILLHQKNNGQASARNLGLKYVSGKYVNFLDADDILMEDTLLHACEFFDEHYNEIDLVAFPMYFFGRKTGDHILNYKFKENFIVPLDSFWDYPQLSASSAIFKSILFDKFEFDTNLISSEDSVMVNKILLEKMSYGVICDGGYCYRRRFDESSTIDKSVNNKKYYIDRLNGYFSELINYSKDKLGYVPKFIQYLIVYDIKWMFLDENKFSMFDSQELIELQKKLRYIFANIEDEVINFHFKNDPYKLKLFMFKLKYDKLMVENDDGIISLKVNNQVIDILNQHNFYIDIIEINDGVFSLSGVLTHYYDKNDFDVVLTKNSNQNYYPKYVSYSNRKESNFSESNLCFDFKVPIDSNEESKIELNIIYNVFNEGVTISLPIKFLNHARMSEICNYSIWGDYFIEFKNNSFFISKYSYKKFLKEELLILIKILKIKGPYWTSALFFHFIYSCLFIFLKNKKIWLVMDRQDRADDNAEHFFTYLNDINDVSNKYFIISKDSMDFSRLSSVWRNIIPFYSFKHRILYLFADKVISSQADEIIVNPFWDKNVKWYSGILTGKKIFLQHGVAKDDMSSWLRKYDKNVKLLVTTSDLEAKSFENYKYHYDEGVVQVLGLPRYDHLSNESQNKQILIMPSWRRSLINADDNQIKESEYFSRFNSLINNRRFIKLAKSHGYKIIFKPHPNTFQFIYLFDTNEYVIIDENSKYQDLFNNSSLLITDYSSLSFDFAYIKKPLIYYQYGNDYHFDDNFFEYETMGFGEVIKNENDLIDTIEQYLNDDCKIKEKYLNRSNTFYKYNDKNNCKRVYNAIKKIK